jgi:3-hydroxyisobutyrate dehydrogenase-like beta-hydroxyacid dehydrogenase
MRVGLLGIGEMGSAFARRLLTRGHEVVGYDPDPGRAKEARDTGVTLVGNALEVATQAQAVVILIVKTSAHAEQACFGPTGCLTAIEGKILLVMSSLDPDFVQRLESETEARGGRLVDATVGSGADAALSGSMLVMVSGDPQARAAADPVLTELADQPEVVGDWVGAAQVAKLITQVTMNVNMAGVVESIRIANCFGLDRKRMIRVIERSPGASFVSQNWQFLAEVMKPHNVANNHKDLRAALRQAIARDLETPVAAAAMYALRHEWPVSVEGFYLS